MDFKVRDGAGRNRLLVTGAAGWFGREALNLGISAGMEILALGSKNSELMISNNKVRIFKYEMDLIRDFEPDVVVDSAFITREQIQFLGHDQFVEQNRALIRKSLEIAELKSVETYVGFSSGATKHRAGQPDSSLKLNPYAFLKKEYEEGIQKIASTVDTQIGIARVWSVSGAFCTKPEIFAFSNFISQAKQGRVFISADHKVSRRYAPISQVLLLAKTFARRNEALIFDTGGPLVELGELAKIVVETVNPSAQITRPALSSAFHDDYFSDGVVWRKLLSLIPLEEVTIRSQIETTCSKIS